MPLLQIRRGGAPLPVLLVLQRLKFLKLIQPSPQLLLRQDAFSLPSIAALFLVFFALLFKVQRSIQFGFGVRLVRYPALSFWRRQMEMSADKKNPFPVSLSFHGPKSNVMEQNNCQRYLWTQRHHCFRLLWYQQSLLSSEKGREKKKKKEVSSFRSYTTVRKLITTSCLTVKMWQNWTYGCRGFHLLCELDFGSKVLPGLRQVIEFLLHVCRKRTVVKRCLQSQTTLGPPWIIHIRGRRPIKS